MLVLVLVLVLGEPDDASAWKGRPVRIPEHEHEHEHEHEIGRRQSGDTLPNYQVTFCPPVANLHSPTTAATCMTRNVLATPASLPARLPRSAAP